MTTLLFVAFAIGLSNLFVAVGVGFLLHFLNTRAHEKELARLMYTFEQAMLLVKATSATDKVQADATKKAADLQLQMLEDALEKERQVKKVEKASFEPEPKVVSGYDATGKLVEVDINDGNWIIQE